MDAAREGMQVVDVTEEDAEKMDTSNQLWRPLTGEEEEEEEEKKKKSERKPERKKKNRKRRKEEEKEEEKRTESIDQTNQINLIRKHLMWLWSLLPLYNLTPKSYLIT